MKALLGILLLLSSMAFAKPGGHHYCRPDSTNISCRLELALVCGDGYIDGCLTQETRVHRCVLKDEGESCATEIQILCPEGFRDGCEINRTSRHQCVPVKGEKCEEDHNFMCPEGFNDDCFEP